MSFNMRVWCILAFAAAFFLVPATAVCQIDPRDPYARQSILAEVTLSFEDFQQNYEDGLKRLDRQFEQIYSLTFKGNLWDPRLIIYDVDFAFDTTDYTTESFSQDNNLFHYGFSTTLLRKLRFPLTLFIYRDTTDISGAAQQENIFDVYGFNWLLKFRLLPVTRLALIKEHTTNSSQTIVQENDTTNFSAEMTKNLGPTRNRLNYTFNETKGVQGTNNGQSGKSISFQNSTDVSRHTKFSFSAIRSSFDNSSVETTGGSGEVTGFSSNVTSNPSENFDQSHSYTFFENKGDQGTQRGETYSGNINYKMTKRLSSRLSLNFGDIKNDTTTTNVNTTSVTISGYLNYVITDHLSVQETASYHQFDSSTPTSTTGEQNRKDLSAITTFIYQRRFEWFNLRSSAGGGYTEQDVEPLGGGKGVTGVVGISLTKIDLNYVNLNTAVNWYKFKSLSGDAFEERRTFSAFSTNNFWEKYVQLTLKYNNYLTKAWIHVLETKTENINFKAKSAYLRSTTISTVADYTKTYTPITGKAVATSGNVRIVHTRRLLGGTIKAGGRFSIRKTDSNGIEETTVSANYFTNYSRLLRRNLLWRTDLQYTDTKYENSFYRTASANNALIYTLRAWLFSAEFDYAKVDDSYSPWTERKIMLKATRSFLRVF